MPAFTQLEPPKGRAVALQFDGQTISANEGEMLAAALLRAGVGVFRQTPEKGSLRGPFCMMGACYDCLVVIDGVTRQACMTPVRDGMTIAKGGTA